MFSLPWQRSFSLPPASFLMKHLPAVAVAVACVPPLCGAADLELRAVDTDIGPFRVALLHAPQPVAVLTAEPPMEQQRSAQQRLARRHTATATTTIAATMTAMAVTSAPANIHISMWS